MHTAPEYAYIMPLKFLAPYHLLSILYHSWKLRAASKRFEEREELLRRRYHRTTSKLLLAADDMLRGSTTKNTCFFVCYMLLQRRISGVEIFTII